MILNSLNVNSFPNRNIFKICFFFKLNNLKKLMFFEIGIFGTFLEVSKFIIFRIFRIANFCYFTAWTCFDFSKSTISKFFFLNLPNCKFLEFSQVEN